jgi:hypothetical protein
MTDAKAPHKASLLIMVEVNELSKTGEQIKKVSTAELKDANIKTKAVYTIEGFDKFECLKKLKRILDEFERQN